nr:hypothetical protein [Abalone asfa-like virus]
MVSVFLIKPLIYWIVIYLKPNIVLKLQDNFMVVTGIYLDRYSPFYYVISNQKLYIIFQQLENYSHEIWISDQIYDKILYYDQTAVNATNRWLQFRESIISMNPIPPVNEEIDSNLNDIKTRSGHLLPANINQTFYNKYNQKPVPFPLVLFPENYQEEITTPGPKEQYSVTFADLSGTEDIPIYDVYISYKFHWFVVYLNSNWTLSLHTNFAIIDTTYTSAPEIPLLFYYVVSNNKFYVLLELTNRTDPKFIIFVPTNFKKILIHDSVTPNIDISEPNSFQSRDVETFYLSGKYKLLPTTPPQKDISTLISDLDPEIALPEHVKDQFIDKYAVPHPPLIIFPQKTPSISYVTPTQIYNELSSLPPLTNG